MAILRASCGRNRRIAVTKVGARQKPGLASRPPGGLPVASRRRPARRRPGGPAGDRRPGRVYLLWDGDGATISIKCGQSGSSHIARTSNCLGVESFMRDSLLLQRLYALPSGGTPPPLLLLPICK